MKNSLPSQSVLAALAAAALCAWPLGTASGQSVTVDQIFRGWSERQSKTTSAKFVWRQTVTARKFTLPPASAESPPESDMATGSFKTGKVSERFGVKIVCQWG